MWIIALVFHAVLIFAAYRVGRKSSGQGIALFVVGVVAFQLIFAGPGSFLDPSSCDYGVRARDC